MALEQALLVLSLFLPGYLLVNVLFPARGSLGGDLDLLYRIFLGVILSVAITILYGTLLVVVGERTGDVLFRPQVLWPGLGAVSAMLFVWGVLRGAYPRLSGLIGRSPAKSVTEHSDEFEVLERLRAVTERLERARRRARKAEAASEARPPEEIGKLIKDLEEEKRRLEEEAREW